MRKEDIERKTRHYEALGKLFGIKVSESTYYRVMRRLELRGERIGLATCNIANFNYERESELFEKCVRKKLPELFEKHDEVSKMLLLNYDPRGYCIKLDDMKGGSSFCVYGAHQDCGRYLILAPEFSND